MYLSLDIAIAQTEDVKRRVWKLSQADRVNLNLAIESFNWDFILRGEDLDTVCYNFTKSLFSLFDMFIPNYVKVIRPKDAPWFNVNIRRAINDRNKCYRKMAKNNSIPHVRRFKDAAKRVKDMIKRSKTSFQDRLCESLNENSANTKNYWHILKQLLGKKFSSGIPTITANNTTLDSDILKCQAFLEKFSNQFHHEYDVTAIPDFHDKTEAVIRDIVISREKVKKMLLNLDVSKQGGEDGLSNQLLKMVASTLDLPLSNLFGLLLRSGHFPSCWKLGIVVPIFKNKGSKGDPENYRPVTLLNSMSKVFERVVYEGIFEHLTLNNLLFERQSGFIAGHDTQKQLVHIVDTILGHIESKMVVRGVFLDISGAFDGVPHYLLTKKLAAYGIKGNLLKLLMNYLSNRRLKVRINGSLSSTSAPHFLNSGVPQGSILGPLLFLIYINDLCDSVKNSILYLYADDCSIFFPVPDHLDPMESTRIMQEDLDNLSAWSKIWKLKFKASKSKEVIFHSPRKRLRVFNDLLMDGDIIPRGTFHKHLGLILDSTLSFNEHLTGITTKCNALLNPLRLLKFSIKSKHLERIYFSFILPHIEYCSVVFDSTNQNTLARLDQVHYRAGLIVSGCPQGTNRLKVFDCLGWMTLEKRRAIKKLTLMYDVEHNSVPSYINRAFTKFRNPEPTVRLRNHRQYNIPVNVSTRYAKSTIPDAIRMWNSLPVEIKTRYSRNAFKYNLRLYIGGPKKRLATTKIPLHRNEEICLNKARCDLIFKAHYYAHNFTFLDNPYCPCGDVPQTTRHLFFHCPRTNIQRCNLFTDLNMLPSFKTVYQTCTVDNDRLDTLLNGNPSIPHDQNVKIVQTVARFISSIGIPI